MADVVDAATRSRMMASIRGKDTRPELLLRRALHRRGLRYRLHGGKLPGRPDLVFPRFRAVRLLPMLVCKEFVMLGAPVLVHDMAGELGWDLLMRTMTFCLGDRSPGGLVVVEMQRELELAEEFPDGFCIHDAFSSPERKKHRDLTCGDIAFAHVLDAYPRARRSFATADRSECMLNMWLSLIHI